MLKSLLSLVTSNNKEKKKKRSTAGLSTTISHQTETAFLPEAYASILNGTKTKIPKSEEHEDPTSISSSRVLGDSTFSLVERKSRSSLFNFRLKDQSQSDAVVHRRNLQPSTPTPNTSDAEHSFIENILDSPGQRNRFHSMIGENIYEAGSGSPQKIINRVSKKL